MIQRKDMPRYYKFADAVIGNMRIGTYGLVELEGVFCKTPVIQYTDPSMKIIVNGKDVKSPFLPYSNDPKTIAEVIDNIVTSKDFRDELMQKEYNFVKEIADPEKVAAWWDDLFEDLVKKHKSIKKNSSPIRIKLRMLYFLIANRLYYKKIKKLLAK